MFKDFVFRGKFGFTERQFCKSLGNSMVSMFLILIYDGIAPHKFSVLLILPLVGKIQYSVLTLEHTNGVTIFIPCTIHVHVHEWEHCRCSNERYKYIIWCWGVEISMLLILLIFVLVKFGIYYNNVPIESIINYWEQRQWTLVVFSSHGF